ncbi:hypothetical protein [Actinoplanes xinjiangensis]|uniref:hypothetical protein n=1 Tax=Actinoplanes xinjiangensis TaxID=512350 RepID=UPI003425DDE6
MKAAGLLVYTEGVADLFTLPGDTLRAAGVVGHVWEGRMVGETAPTGSTRLTADIRRGSPSNQVQE